jgi:hypothetical protein
MADLASGGGQGAQRQSVGWKIHGIPELQAKLTAMGKGGKLASVLRSAVRAAVNKTKSDATARLVQSPSPAGETYRRESYRGHWSYNKKRLLFPGYAKRHVIVKTYVSRDKRSATAAVGPTKEAFYASQFLEFGIPSAGYPAQPWLGPSFEANRTMMADATIKKINQRLRQLARQKPVGVKR